MKLANTKNVKKFFSVFFILILVFNISFNIISIEKVFASPEQALNESNLAEKLLIKLQNKNYNEEVDKLYKYLNILCHENTQFYSYKLEELELLMDDYREQIIQTARDLASKEEYKTAVEFLESKSELFKDKSTINSLISHYSKFFIKAGLFYSEIAPKILSINKLIAYPSLAFNDNVNSENYDKLYLTSKEFSNLLQELYLNDYILININDFLDLESETITKKDLYLPPNKKPIILIFNDINYYENETPFIEKFIIDSKNEISCFNSKQIEKNQISQNTDFIPLLENFIETNKDFSHAGAKAVITFEQNGGILGYNINKTNPNLNQEVLNLKKLAGFLKEKGYIFGYSFKSLDKEEQENEIAFLQNDIFNVFGNLKILFTNSQEHKLQAFYYKLGELGFKAFISTGENFTVIKNNLALISSVKIDGVFLRNLNSTLNLNNEKIYDHTNRTKIYK